MRKRGGMPTGRLTRICAKLGFVGGESYSLRSRLRLISQHSTNGAQCRLQGQPVWGLRFTPALREMFIEMEAIMSSRFYGWLNGSAKTSVKRSGTASTGITSKVQNDTKQIRVELYTRADWKNGIDWVRITCEESTVAQGQEYHKVILDRPLSEI